MKPLFPTFLDEPMKEHFCAEERCRVPFQSSSRTVECCPKCAAERIRKGTQARRARNKRREEMAKV